MTPRVVVARGGGPRPPSDQRRRDAAWLRTRILEVAAELGEAVAYERRAPDPETLRRRLVAIAEGREP